jgi:hypothetical protein
VSMLQQVLLSADSKPSQILSSLFANDAASAESSSASRLRWRPATNGIEVQVPAPIPQIEGVEQSTVPRRLSRLHPPEQLLHKSELKIKPSDPSVIRRSILPSSFTAEQQLATSASSSSNAHDSKVSLSEQSQSTEWMSIRCQPCKMTGPEGGARAFVMGPTPLSIVVCTNRLQHLTTNPLSNNNSAAARNEMEEILTHELVHVYDVRQLQLDLRDCESLANSEVRAAREAECRNYVDLSVQRQPRPAWYTLGLTSTTTPTRRSCAKHTAQTATSNLFPNQLMAEECVQKVFERAYRDTRPFAPSSQRQVPTPQSSSQNKSAAT